MEDQADSSSGVSPVHLPPGPVGGCPRQQEEQGSLHQDYSSSAVSPVKDSTTSFCILFFLVNLLKFPVIKRTWFVTVINAKRSATKDQNLQ